MHPVPAPLHLQGVDHVVMPDFENPPSPVHPRFTSRAVEKVMSWLDQKDDEEDEEVVEDFKSTEKCDSASGLAPTKENDLRKETLGNPHYLNVKIASNDQVTESGLVENIIEDEDIQKTMRTNSSVSRTLSSIGVVEKKEPRQSL